jgi:hypothetical protein
MRAGKVPTVHSRVNRNCSYSLNVLRRVYIGYDDSKVDLRHAARGVKDQT